MKHIISRLEFTDKVAAALVAVLVLTFVVNPTGGATLLGTTIGMSLDFTVFLPAIMVGYLFHGNKKEKIIAAIVAIVLSVISALFIARDFESYVFMIFLRFYALMFISCLVGYVTKFFITKKAAKEQ